MAELRDGAIWAATCDLKAQVLRNDRRPLVARAVVPWVALAICGLAAVLTGHPVVGGILIVAGTLPTALIPVALRDAGHLMLEADGFTYRAPGGRVRGVEWTACDTFAVRPASLRTPRHVTWTAADGAPAGAFLPGAGGLEPEDLAVLLNRYRLRFAPRPGDAGAPG